LIFGIPARGAFFFPWRCLSRWRIAVISLDLLVCFKTREAFRITLSSASFSFARSCS
jgi:hypothetical protein